jgi:ribose transport system permease protein
VIITGGIDLSVGTSMALVAVITGKTVMAYDLNVWTGILLGMVVGGLLGAINGLLITVLKLPAFIATLATMKGAQGLALIISDMKPILFATDVEGWDQIARGNIIPNFPNAVLILFVAAIIGSLILNKTVLGRYNFAIGSNLEATKLSGVKVNRWLVAIYALCGVLRRSCCSRYHLTPWLCSARPWSWIRTRSNRSRHHRWNIALRR